MLVSVKTKDTTYRILLIGGIIGFELAAGLSAIVGVSSTPTSVTFRLIVLLLAIFLIYHDFVKILNKKRFIIILFCFFWLLYLARVTISTTITMEPISHPGWYYYIWVIGACALPMIGISLWTPRYEDSERNFLSIYTMISIAGILAALSASTLELNQNYDLIDTGRLQLVSINPILLGQLGTTIIVLSIWVLVNRQNFYSISIKLIFLSLLILGGVLLIGSNSRGPLVSAFSCLLFIALISNRKSRLISIGILSLVIFTFIPATQYLENEFGFATYTRLFGQSQLTEENTLDRLSRFSGALNVFYENPLFGSRIEEPKHGGYPHNIILEALMSTGLIGCSLMLILIFVSFIYAIRLYKHAQGYGWASVLFVQYFISAQFSGGIHSVNYLWFSIGLIVSFYATFVMKKFSR